MSRADHRTNAILAAGALGSALLVTGCGAGGDVEAPAAPLETDEDGSSQEGAAPAPDDDLAAQSLEVSWTDAVSAAQQEFDGRLTSLELDSERQGYVYSVDLVSGSEEYEALVSASSGEILRDETESLDGDDAAEAGDEVFELEGLVEPGDAMTAATGEAEGAARSWSLDREWDGIFYEVEVAPSAGDDLDVTIDAESGEVVEVD